MNAAKKSAAKPVEKSAKKSAAPVTPPAPAPAPAPAETPRTGGRRAGASRQPNIGEDKTRVAAYLTRDLAKTLAHRCIDLGVSQSDAVTRAIVAWLDANAPAAQKPAAK